jgi:hypothetical protein
VTVARYDQNGALLSIAQPAQRRRDRRDLVALGAGLQHLRIGGDARLYLPAKSSSGIRKFTAKTLA